MSTSASTTGTTPAIAPPAMRTAMSRFATGVVVITVGGDQPHGMTANAITSLSLDPPLLLCCVAHEARMHHALSTRGRFAISVLGADQEDVARHFADKNRPLGPAEFAGVDWSPGLHTGAPLMTNALACLECELVQSQSCADHTIFVGRVLDTTLAGNGDGLLFYLGRYRSITAEPR